MEGLEVMYTEADKDALVAQAVSQAEEESAIVLVGILAISTLPQHGFLGLSALTSFSRLQMAHLLHLPGGGNGR
jgi:hypothetical protein